MENKTIALIKELKSLLVYSWDEYAKYSELHDFSRQKFMIDIYDNIIAYLEHVERVRGGTPDLDDTLDFVLNEEKIKELLNAIFKEKSRVHVRIHNYDTDAFFEERLLVNLYDSIYSYLEFLVEENIV